MVVLLSVISLFNTFKLSFNGRKYDLEVFETNLLFFSYCFSLNTVPVVPD